MRRRTTQTPPSPETAGLKSQPSAGGSPAAEELLSRPDGARRLGVVPKRAVGFSAPCADREHLAVRVRRAAAEVLVDDPGALAALGDRGHDQRLSDARVAARVHASDGGSVGLPGANVGAAVELYPQLLGQALVLGVLESDCHQDQVRLEREPAARAPR